MVEVERIYVGGVDPPRLTVEELLSRIASDVKDTVELQDMAISSIYCHFNATSLQPGVSALETIRKLYNNVKWKGCKIKVEAAKPHYLERLVKERDERSVSLEQQQLSEREPVPIPRHLKIRRGYGEESWKIDTKPCEVSDWSTFRKMRTRLLEKQAQAREKKHQTVKTSAWNRAVLLRFQESEGVAFSQRLKHPASLDQSDSEDESEVADDNSSSSSEDSSSRNNAVQENRKNGAYVWSDSSDNESETDEEGKEAFEIEANKDETYQQELEKSPSEEESVLLESDEKKDDASSSEQETAKISANDVQANLNILAQIFPDLEGKKPHSDLGKNEGKTVKGSSDTRKGWTDMGQMVRFDPTQLSSEKFIVEPSISGSATEDEEMEMKGRDDDSVEESVSSEQDEKKLNTESVVEEGDAAGKIYEQEMLEQVFKATREPEFVEAENRLSRAPIQQSGFSFSFQVQESEQTVAKTIVQLPVTTKKEVSEPILAEPMEIEQEEPKQKRLRRGVAFPDKDLDAYVNFFFSQGDGSRIMSQGVHAYREDPHVQASWASQRRILTQDWRRKHKYAVAQKRKRFGR